MVLNGFEPEGAELAVLLIEKETNVMEVIGEAPEDRGLEVQVHIEVESGARR